MFQLRAALVIRATAFRIRSNQWHSSSFACIANIHHQTRPNSPSTRHRILFRQSREHRRLDAMLFGIFHKPPSSSIVDLYILLQSNRTCNFHSCLKVFKIQLENFKNNLNFTVDHISILKKFVSKPQNLICEHPIVTPVITRYTRERIIVIHHHPICLPQSMVAWSAHNSHSTRVENRTESPLRDVGCLLS